MGFPVAAAVGLDPASVAAVLAALAANGRTLSAAESLTGGLLLAVLTEVPGSSAVVRGGFVVYATDLKHRLAGVEGDLLDRCGPVDPAVAGQLAIGARDRCGATVGLGLTGVAGPDPQSGVPVGTYYIALAGPETDIRVAQGRANPDGPVPSRAAVRAGAVQTALRLLSDYLGVTEPIPRGDSHSAAIPPRWPGPPE